MSDRKKGKGGGRKPVSEKKKVRVVNTEKDTTTVMEYAEDSKVAKQITEANALRGRNQYEEAIAIMNEVIKADVKNTDAWNLLGMIHKQKGESGKADQCFQQALQINPADWCAHNNRGVVYKDNGLYVEAMGELNAALRIRDDLGLIKNNMATVLTDYGTRLKLGGNAEEAINRYNEAIAYNPSYSPAHFNLGVVWSENEEYEKALRHYNAAITYNPSYAEALCNIGVIHKGAGRLDEAIRYYEMSLKANPNFTLASNNLAIAYTDLGTKVKTEGDVELGLQYYKKALVYNPKYAPAWYNLGVANAEQGRTDAAIVEYQMAITFDGKCAEAYNNLGVIFKDRGNLEKSIYYYKKALEANPRFAQTLNNLGVIYTMLGKLDEAYSYCHEAIAANKYYAEAYNNLGVLYRDEGKIKEAIESYDRCLAIDINSRNAGQNRLLAMNSLYVDPPSDAAELSLLEHVYKEHKAWGDRFASHFQPYSKWENALTTKRPLRIGYLSADFFIHSVSYFIEAPLRYANKTKVYNICYSNVVRKDKKTEILHEVSHAWRSVYGMSAHQVAELIRKDEVDILIELTGHTAGNRLDVMALKPTPIQITWIGYPNTTGLPTIDYRITDGIADLPDTKQKYTEKLIRLPGPFLCYTPPHEAPEVAEAPAVANGYVTFGSFNNLAKVNSRVLAAWCAILKAVPTSRMLVKCKPFATESIRKQMQQKFEDLGVDAKRVELTALLPTTKEHLSMYALVDMGLDTFPYAGTTTTCEALFMGVPVVTLTRPSNHAHSVGATLLSRIEGLQEFVCSDEKEYVAKAVALASDIKRLAALRQTLRPNMLKSPVADGKGFTKGLEKQFHSLWKDYVKGAKKQRKSISSPISPSGSSE